LTHPPPRTLRVYDGRRGPFPFLTDFTAISPLLFNGGSDLKTHPLRENPRFPRFPGIYVIPHPLTLDLSQSGLKQSPPFQLSACMTFFLSLLSYPGHLLPRLRATAPRRRRVLRTRHVWKTAPDLLHGSQPGPQGLSVKKHHQSLYSNTRILLESPRPKIPPPRMFYVPLPPLSLPLLISLHPSPPPPPPPLSSFS